MNESEISLAEFERRQTHAPAGILRLLDGRRRERDSELEYAIKRRAEIVRQLNARRESFESSLRFLLESEGGLGLYAYRVSEQCWTGGCSFGLESDEWVAVFAPIAIGLYTVTATLVLGHGRNTWVPHGTPFEARTPAGVARFRTLAEAVERASIWVPPF